MPRNPLRINTGGLISTKVPCTKSLVLSSGGVAEIYVLLYSEP